MRTQWKSRFCGFVAVCAVVFAAVAAFADPATTEQPARHLMFPPANTPEARLVRVQVGPHIFDIPRNARDIHMDVTGKLGALSLQVLFPTMGGLAPEVGRRMVLLGQDARDLQVLLDDRQRSSERNPSRAQLAHLWGLVTDRIRYSYDGTSSLEKLMEEADRLNIERDTIFSLTQFKLTDKTSGRAARFSMRDGRALFADISGGDVQSVIECSGQQEVPNPQCIMEFTFRTLKVRIHFVQALLPDWRAIRDGFSRYLDERCVNC
jgi:hypothetical protein